MLRSVALALLVICAAVCGAAPALAQEEPGLDLSMLDIYQSMPVDLSQHAPTPEESALHLAAGSIADEAIADAQRESALLEVDEVQASSIGKWDESVPEVHLKSARPVDELLQATQLETVDHLDHAVADLTAPAAMASAFPKLGGEQQSLIQQSQQMAVDSQAAAEASVEAQVENQVVVVSAADIAADSAADAESLIGAESESMTVAELESELSSEGMSEADITQFLASLGDAVAEANGELDSEAETESETETEVETESESESEAEAESETDNQSEAESESESEFESEGESESESEESAEAEGESEVEQSSEESAMVETASEADSETETESESASDADLDAEVEEGMDAEASEAADDVVHLSARPAPKHLQKSTPATVTPIRSAAWKRAHPKLRRLSASAEEAGYSLPSPGTSLLQTASKTTEVDTSKFNPSAIQLGPSKDVYGYSPMTGAEFLASQSTPASLAQVSMQMQHQQATWLPPPVAAEATPLYVVEQGGLRPNVRAGPYQGQYGLAAGGQPVAEEPQFIEIVRY